MTIEGPDGPLGIVKVDQFPMIRQWNIVHASDRNLSLVARAFLDFAMDEKQRITQEMRARWPDVVIN